LRDTRSPSQVLFSLLPDQSVDLKGNIWKVDQWMSPIAIQIDSASVRSKLLSAVDPWRQQAHDAGMSQALAAGAPVQVIGVNKAVGVKVSLWPNNWVCTNCRRLTKNGRIACVCGTNRWGQFHFIAFHDCGYAGEPWIAPCPAHGQVAVNSPKSSSVKDLIFSCPVCSRELNRGLGAGRKCPGCEQPGLSFNVHRAASVFTPHSLTMVNPARPEQLAALKADGGRPKCLDWVLDGMPGDRPAARPQTKAQFIELLARSTSIEAAEAAARAMEASGHAFAADELPLPIVGAELEYALDAALDISLAVFEGRRSARRVQDEPVGVELQTLYSGKYIDAVEAAGLYDVDLVDRFPVLRGVFGYSRGGGLAGEKRLVAFRGAGGVFQLHADANETEALMIRLDPVRVADWLASKGLLAGPPSSAREARIAILEACQIPAKGDELDAETAGSAVLTLLHSYSHRLIRQLAVMAGIDRESIAEYVVPEHLTAYVYATPRGDFVLGGMQAVFETELHTLLERQVSAEQRCPLDPACSRAGGACLACLHLGEPSCSYYNRFLDRTTLFGGTGFLSVR
jgi:hypothetical protein